MTRTVHRFLRSPKIIVGEIAALGLAGAVGAALPQLRVFHSPYFAALCLLAAASLLVVVLEQIRRRRTGSLVFHAGLLLVIIAGAVRALFSSEAVVDLVEGETLPPTAWTSQSPCLFARPFQLDRPVTLEVIHGSRYPSGALRELSARLSAGEVGVNRQLRVGDGRLFLSQEFGPTALLEWSSGSPRSERGKREAVMLDSNTHEGLSTGPNGLRVHLRAHAKRPDTIEARVMRGPGLLYTGDLRIGQTIKLAGGETLTLHGAPMWARFHGSRDHSLWLAYSGFALVLAGSVLLFLFPPRCSRAALPARLTATERRGYNVPATASLLLLAFALTACSRTSRDDVHQLVLRYNQIVSEAYRRGDVRLVDPVVGPREGKKLTGLIGVRLDMGLTLDSQLLTLEVTGVERGKDELRVRTKESWRYCDRKIGTGEQVGEASEDSYVMLYVFKNINKAWLVDEIQFAAPPQVGRQTMTWATTHGVETKQ